MINPFIRLFSDCIDYILVRLMKFYRIKKIKLFKYKKTFYSNNNIVLEIKMDLFKQEKKKMNRFNIINKINKLRIYN
jgi:molybdopterin-guanine dinucleotide biosynthesis protein